MINIYTTSSIKGCIDYEQLAARGDTISFVENYTFLDIIFSLFRRRKHIFQFRIRYTIIYMCFFLSPWHYLDFRTLSVSSSSYYRSFSNSIIGFFLRKFKRSIADPTAYRYLHAQPKLTFGLGTKVNTTTLNFTNSPKVKFVFIGSINRVNFECVRELFDYRKFEGSSLDIFSGGVIHDHILSALYEIFEVITIHDWCEYNQLQETLPKFDIGLNYVDPDIYRTQVPLKILDYASAGLFTLTNTTQAIRDNIPEDTYITTVNDLSKLTARSNTDFKSPFGDWHLQVTRLLEALDQ